MADAQEASFEQVALVELTLEKSRARAEHAANAQRDLDAEPHLIEAVEEVRDELSALARLLRQSTYFAVPEPAERADSA